MDLAFAEPEAASVLHETGLDAVALKAIGRVFQAWRLPNAEAARLSDMSLRTWGRAKAVGTASLTQDQRLRASALVGVYKALHLYFGDELADKWPTMANRGPLFRGRTPVAYMIEGGLPAIIETRNYVDAVRGGV